MRRLFIVYLLFMCVHVFASLNTIVPENHYSYSVIKDFTSRKLLIAPEIYREGSILTRKDIGILAVMMLANTDDALYLNRLDYYDAKSLLQLVIDFSDEINFYFSSESPEIEKRIKRLEKKLELPKETIISQRKKVDIPDREQRKVKDFETVTRISLNSEVYNSDNNTAFTFFYPDKDDSSMIKTNINIRSEESIDDHPVFMAEFDSWYVGAGSDVNTYINYNDPMFKLVFSSTYKDENFFVNSSAFSDKYACFSTGKIQLIKRFNMNRDIDSTIINYNPDKRYTVNFLKVSTDSLTNMPTGLSSDIFFGSYKLNNTYFEYGFGDVSSAGVDIASPKSLALKYDSEIQGGNLNVEYISQDAFYNIYDNVYGYRSVNTVSQAKEITNFYYSKRINNRISAAIGVEDDSSDDGLYYNQNNSFLINYNMADVYYMFNFINNDEFDGINKVQPESTDIINLTMSKPLKNNDYITYTFTDVDNSTAYKGISRTVSHNNFNYYKSFSRGTMWNVYVDFLETISIDTLDVQEVEENKNSVGLNFEKMKQDGNILKLNFDYIDSTGLKKYVEGKMYVGMNLARKDFSDYEIGFEFIDHTGKNGDPSFTANNIIFNYIKNY